MLSAFTFFFSLIYSLMIDLFLFTFNCGKRNPPPIINTIEHKLPRKCPDLFVFGFQEISTILHGTSYNTIDKILTIVSNQLKDDLAIHYKKEIKQVGMCHYGNVGLVILTSDMENINEIINCRGVPIGLYFTSLKGSIGLRVQYKSEVFTFVVLHLNAGEQEIHYKRRNKDLKTVLTGIKFDDGLSVLKPDSHCFLLGDFNYRVNSKGEDEFKSVFKSHLIHFQESPVNFQPSYKFKIGSDQYDSKRVPSWCDRIVYLTNDDEDVKEYNLIKENTHSDHKPVFLHIKIPLHKPNKALVQSELFGYDLNQDVNYKIVSIVDSFMWIILTATTTPMGLIILTSIVISLIIFYTI